jgi:phenylacetic acid degradation protein
MSIPLPFDWRCDSGQGVYIGPNASLRGDFGRIVVKDGANIGDNCVMHGFPEQDTVVEEDGHIGHSAILHGCIIRRNALVGMNAVVMDGAVIGENSIVGAAAFESEGGYARQSSDYRQSGESHPRTERARTRLEKTGTREYQVLVERCKKTMHQVEPGWLDVNDWNLMKIYALNRQGKGCSVACYRQIRQFRVARLSVTQNSEHSLTSSMKKAARRRFLMALILV